MLHNPNNIVRKAQHIIEENIIEESSVEFCFCRISQPKNEMSTDHESAAKELARKASRDLMRRRSSVTLGTVVSTRPHQYPTEPFHNFEGKKNIDWRL